MPDPILERTVRQVRAERSRARRRRGGVVAAVAAARVTAVLAGGVHLGRLSAPGDRVLVATTADGVRLTTAVTPADGWVRLRAAVDGIHPGERCRLVVTDLRGTRHVAGGWVASRSADTALSGAVLVVPDEPASVSVVTVDGRVLVSARTP
ncbi:MAG: hypothetical protein HOV94_10255 [Saccharothrix sp.]|nr:hypothetical protein [Saccharothrix sp.]